MPNDARVARVGRGAALVAELRTGAADARLVEDVQELLVEHQRAEAELVNTAEHDATMLRLAVVTERLLPFVERLTVAEETRANAALTDASAKKTRADTLAKVATPRNALAAIVILGLLIGGAIGLPVRDIAALWFTNGQAATTTAVEPSAVP